MCKFVSNCHSVTSDSFASTIVNIAAYFYCFRIYICYSVFIRFKFICFNNFKMCIIIKYMYNFKHVNYWEVHYI